MTHRRTEAHVRKTLLLALAILLLGTEAFAQAKRPVRDHRSKQPRVPTFEEFAASRERGWRLVAESPDSRLYYDPSRTFQLANGVVRLWVKFIYIAPADGAFSSSVLEECDCPNARRRSIAFTTYDGGGRVLVTDEESARPWRYVTPDSISETLLNVVCKGERKFELRNLEYASIAYDLAVSFERDGKYDLALFNYDEVDRITPHVPMVEEAIRRVKSKMPRRLAKPLPKLPQIDSPHPVTPPQ
jgi:hypothetical protein